MYEPQTTILDGMTAAQLQSALTQAQAAYVALMTGSKGESFSYAMGDGTRSVTYTRASIAGLTMFILQLQKKLGINPYPRRARRLVYR